MFMRYLNNRNQYERINTPILNHYKLIGKSNSIGILVSAIEKGNKQIDLQPRCKCHNFLLRVNGLIWLNWSFGLKKLHIRCFYLLLINFVSNL